MRTAFPMALTVILTLAGCADPSGPAHPIIGAEALAARPVRDIPIAFTVDDASPHRIRSDGQGEYVNGVSGMGAKIDDVGNLQITGSTRRLVFDYPGAQVTGTPYTPDTTGMQGMRIVSQNNVTPAVPRIQDMAVGSTACYGLTIPFSTGVRQIRNYYHGYQEAPASSSSVHAFITRTSATTWSLTTSGPCPVNADWAGVWTLENVKKAVSVFRGYFAMPFSMSFRLL